MGRHVGRSRGCQICRQRKIKCDEKTPECSQCLRSGKNCPGPLEGILFLDAKDPRTKPTVRDNKPPARRPNHRSTTSHTPPEVSLSHEGDSTQSFKLNQASSSEDDSIVRRAASAARQSRLPSIYQPTRSPAFQELFLDHFINAFFDPRVELNQASEWSIMLPSFLQLQEQTASIVHAIRAATMAHYGKISGDTSIQLNSMRWYSSSLEIHQQENAVTQRRIAEGGEAGDIFNEILISTPIMLMFFESVMGTLPSAWARYLKAASLMLEIMGPWRCRQGILHHIFKVVRVGAVYMGVTWEKTTIFASKEWCTIPFLEIKKTAYDRLNDILLQIPECLDMSHKLRQERMERSSSLQATTLALEGKAQWLNIRLQEYWKEFGDEVDLDYTWDQYHEESSFQTSAKEWIMEASRPARFRNKFAARIISDYDAGYAIIFSVLREVHFDSVEEYRQRVAVHCASILEAVAFLQNLGVESGGNTSLLFPLKTVNLCSPCQQQAANSAIELARWGKTRGVEGACEVIRDSSDDGPRNATLSYPL